MAIAKLLTCPFCGSKPSLLLDPGRGGHNDCPPSAQVRCNTCWACGPLVYASQSPIYASTALSLWNDRAACCHFVAVEISFNFPADSV